MDKHLVGRLHAVDTTDHHLGGQALDHRRRCLLEGYFCENLDNSAGLDFGVLGIRSYRVNHVMLLVPWQQWRIEGSGRQGTPPPSFVGSFGNILKEGYRHLLPPPSLSRFIGLGPPFQKFLDPPLGNKFEWEGLWKNFLS